MEIPPTVFGYHIEMIYSFRKLLYTIFLLKSSIYFPTKADTNIGSTLTPGPIVREIATDLKYCPFEAAGFNLII